MADPFSAVPGFTVPGEAWPGNPAESGAAAAQPVPVPGAAQRPVIIAFRN